MLRSKSHSLLHMFHRLGFITPICMLKILIRFAGLDTTKLSFPTSAAGQSESVKSLLQPQGATLLNCIVVDGDKVGAGPIAAL